MVLGQSLMVKNMLIYIPHPGSRFVCRLDYFFLCLFFRKRFLRL